MDLLETWTNYKSLLFLADNNNEQSVKDFFNQLCSPSENLTNSTKLTQLLALSIELKNCQIVSLLLRHGIRGKPSCEELFKYTPMQRAVLSGSVTLIHEMIQCVASYDEVDEDGNTLLHLAIVNRNERWTNVEYSRSRMLMKSQAEETIIQTFEILLSLGLNVDALNLKGESSLSLAVDYRMKAVTEFLVERGALLNVFGKTVSHFLIMKEIEFSRISKADSNVFTAEDPWTEMQKRNFLEWWFSKKLDIDCQSGGDTPIQLAVRHNMKDILLLLFQYTNEINVIDAVGHTPLHISIGSIESSLRVKSQPCEIDEAIDMIKLLMEKGIPVDEADRCGNTPFHIAAKLKRPEIMQTIIGYFSNVNACNNMKETALHIIMKNFSNEYEDEYLEIASELIRKGADFDCQDRYGRTPLHFVCLKNTKISRRIVNFLVEQGCDVNIKDENGVTPLFLAIRTKSTRIIEILMNNGADVNFCDKSSKSTPLHEASRKNLSSVVKWLLKAGAKTDLKDNLEQTPLHIAVSSGHLSQELVSLLLMYGADVEVLDKDKKTPLLRAFDANDYNRVEKLLDFGAKINIERSRLVPSRAESSICNTKTLVIKHLVARFLAGLAVRSCYTTVVQRACRDFAHFREQCLQELDTIKNTEIDGVCAHDLFCMSYKRRYSYMTKNTLKRFMTDYEYLRDQFPIYQHIISATYWTAVNRKPLLDSAKYAWYQLSSISLPEMCVEMILSYLENSDLKCLIEAGV